MTIWETQYWEILPESALGNSRIITELNHWLVTSREWVNRTLYRGILGKNVKSNGTDWSNICSKYLYLICVVYQLGQNVYGLNQEFSLFYTKLNITGKTGSANQILLPRVMKMPSRWLIPFVLRHTESVLEKSLALRSPVPVFTGRVGSRSYPAPASGEHRAGEPAEATRELF